MVIYRSITEQCSGLTGAEVPQPLKYYWCKHPTCPTQLTAVFLTLAFVNVSEHVHYQVMMVLWLREIDHFSANSCCDFLQWMNLGSEMTDHSSNGVLLLIQPSKGSPLVTLHSSKRKLDVPKHWLLGIRTECAIGPLRQSCHWKNMFAVLLFQLALLASRKRKFKVRLKSLHLLLYNFAHLGV